MARLFPNNNFVPPKAGTGNTLVLLEAPDAEEERQLEPAVGPTGKKLDSWLGRVGYSRAEVTIGNSVNCRPPSNAYPTSSEARSYIALDEGKQAVAHCYQNHVLPLLQSQPWEKVLLFGDRVLQQVTGKQGIKRWGGSPLAIPALGPEPRALATYHPAAIMREERMLPLVFSDLRKELAVPAEAFNIQPTPEDVPVDLPAFAADIETDRETQAIKMVGISWENHRAVVVPFAGEYIDRLKLLFAQVRRVVLHNGIAFDLPVLAANGITVADDCEICDTLLQHSVLWPGLPHDLGFVARQLLNVVYWKDWQEDGVPEETYCGKDTCNTWEMAALLEAQLRKANLWSLYADVVVPLAKICRLMHETGILRDPLKIAAMRERFQQRIRELELQLPEHLRTYKRQRFKNAPAPEGTRSEKTGKLLKVIKVPFEEEIVPWHSDQVVAKFLYEELGLPKQTDPDTGRVSTGKQALDRLYNKSKRPEVATLKEIRQCQSKVTSNLEIPSPGTERLHTHFNVSVASTGRLSSSDPLNLQNIPEEIRVIYVPSHPDWCLIQSDFSQAENRLTAWFSKDWDRLKRFEDPAYSEHKYAASVFFGIPLAEVKKDNSKDAPYGKAKRIVHGSGYLMGARKLSQMYDMDPVETQRLLDKWKAANPKTTAWQQATVDKAAKQKWLVNPFGRRGLFYEAGSGPEAVAFLPQSTAADVIFRAMISLLYERIGWSAERARTVVPKLCPLPQPARLLVSVHDSLVLETRRDQVAEVVATVREAMSQPWPQLDGFSIPVAVEVGQSWGEMVDAEKWLVEQEALIV